MFNRLMSPEQRHLRARIAAGHRHGQDPTEVNALSRKLRVARAADFLADLLTGDQPPTDAERAELAALLWPDTYRPAA